MELKQTRDSIVDKLTETHGEPLEITSNITSSAQIDAVMDGFVSMQFGSKYARGQVELLLRMSLGWQGRARDDLTGIGKVPDYSQGWNGSGDDER